MRRSRGRAGGCAHAGGDRCSSCSAAASLSVQPASVRVGDPSSELTNTSSRSPGTSCRRVSTSERRSAERGTCTVTSAYFAALRIVELRMVSEASFSFGITSLALSSVRMNVYISPISSTPPSTPPTSTQSPSRSGCVDGDHQPGDEVSERPLRREADDQAEDRRGRQEAAGDGAHLWDDEERREQPDRRRSRPRSCGAGRGSGSWPRATGRRRGSGGRSSARRRSSSRGRSRSRAGVATAPWLRVSTAVRSSLSSAPRGDAARPARTRRLAARDVVAARSLLLIVLGYGGRLAAGDPPADALYRYSTAIGAIFIYGVFFLILLVIARGLPAAGVLRAAPPGVMAEGARARLAAVRHDLHRRRTDHLACSAPATSRA